MFKNNFEAEEYILPSTPPPSGPTCDDEYNITSSANGAYIKTACYMQETLLNKADASNFCASMGMKLYTIQSADELQELFTFVSDYAETYSWVLIDGTFSNNVWSISNPSGPLIGAGVPSAGFYVPEGGCLYATKNSTRGGYCDKSDFMCEYVVVS
jgi:hypothetical protein